MWKVVALVSLASALATSRAEALASARGFLAQTEFADISDTRVSAAVAEAFPKLMEEQGLAATLDRAANDQTMRGNLRGRIAESDWLDRNAADGWRRTASRIAPENDAWRRLADGNLEGAQVKVHGDWKEYLRSMRKDGRAERFVIPDDHLELVRADLLTRRQGALRGGQAGKAASYGRLLERLTPLGRTFSEVDSAIERTVRTLGATGAWSKAAKIQARAALRSNDALPRAVGKEAARATVSGESLKSHQIHSEVADDVLLAGAKARKLLRAAPVAGVVAEVGYRGYQVYQTEQEFQAGAISAHERGARHAENAGGAVGGVAGAFAGAAVGGAAGAACGGVGAVPGVIFGAIVGGLGGGLGGDMAGSRAGRMIYEKW